MRYKFHEFFLNIHSTHVRHAIIGSQDEIKKIGC